MALRGGPVGSPSTQDSDTVPGWRPDDLLALQTELFDEGVVKGNGGELAVTEHAGGANMSVDVASGKILIEVTTTFLTPNYTYKPFLTNTATRTVTVPAADATHPRIDRIIAKFDMTVNPDGSAANNVSIELVEGTPAASPAAPAVPSNARSLSQIAVAAGATSITNADITDERTYIDIPSDSLASLARETSITAIHNNTPFSATATGSANAYAITLTNNLTALAAGQRFSFIANHDNTGPSTLNVTLGGLAQGAKAIKKFDGATSLAEGDIKNGQIVLVEYDGTNFQMLSISSIPPSVTHPVESRWTTGGASANFGASTTSETFVATTHQYEIPADDWAAGDEYSFDCVGVAHRGNSNDTATIKVYLGATALKTYTFSNNPGTAVDGSFRLKGKITCRATGTPGTLEYFLESSSKDGNAAQLDSFPIAVSTGSWNTTDAQTLKVSVTFSVSRAENYGRIDHLGVVKLNAA